MSSKGSAPKIVSRRTGGTATKTGSDAGKQSGSVSARSLFNAQGSQVTPKSTVTNATRNISPQSSRFTKLILEPRGILINNTNSIVPSAFSHFSTGQPEDDKTINYKSIAGLSGAHIWVTLNNNTIKDIAAKYKEMRGQNLYEEEFATLAKEQFLHSERRSRAVSQDRQ